LKDRTKRRKKTRVFILYTFKIMIIGRRQRSLARISKTIPIGQSLNETTPNRCNQFSHRSHDKKQVEREYFAKRRKKTTLYHDYWKKARISKTIPIGQKWCQFLGRDDLVATTK
jgi:hypothetical protein